MKETKERVDELTTINFSITKCPIKIFKNFRNFCKKETNDNYSFGLKILLESREANIKEVILYEQYTELRDKIILLEEKLLKNKTTKKKPLKTMGSEEKNE